MLYKWAVAAVDRIAFGGWHLRCGFSGAAIAPCPDVGFAAAGIGADHQEIAARRQLSMADAGGDHHHVARGDLGLKPALASEARPDMTAHDAQDLVLGGVEMVVVIDAVSPGVAPAMAVEQILAAGGSVAAQRQNLPIDDKGETVVVGNRAVGRQPMDLDLCRSHRSDQRPPLLCCCHNALLYRRGALPNAATEGATFRSLPPCPAAEPNSATVRWRQA